MADRRIKVQNALKALVDAHDFPAVSYDPTTGVASVEGTAKAASVFVNEVRSRYKVDPNYGRAEVLKREGWQFQLMLAFHEEVSLDSFLEALMENPPVVPKDDEHSTMRLHLSTDVVNHPPQQQSSSGTQALLVFIAIPGRI